MNWLLDALFKATFLFIPTWGWVVIALIGGVLIYRVFGWKATAAFAVGALVFLAESFGARKGAEIEKAKQAKADQKARDVIAEKKADVADDTDAELGARLDRWTKDNP